MSTQSHPSYLCQLHVRQFVAEHISWFCIRNGQIQRRLSNANGLCGHTNAGQLQLVHCNGKSFANVTDNVCARDPYVLQHNATGGRRLDAHFAFFASNWQAGHIERHNKRCDTFVTAFFVYCGKYYAGICFRRRRYPRLWAVQHIVVTVQNGTCADVGHIWTGICSKMYSMWFV